MSEIAFIGKRGRGRPASTEPKSVLSAYVPVSFHDRLTQLALKHDVSVSAVVCQVLQKAFDMPRQGISLQKK